MIMHRKNIRGFTLAVLTSILMVAFTMPAIRTTDAESNSLQNQNCIYRIDGALMAGNGSCSSEGTPTVLSQVKGNFSGSFDPILENEIKEYRIMVLQHQQCGPCYEINITEACKYDSNGNFIPHLSDVQKAVVLDLKTNFSIPVCLFTGRPEVPYPIPPPNATITGGGAVNVTELGEVGKGYPKTPEFPVAATAILVTSFVVLLFYQRIQNVIK